MGSRLLDFLVFVRHLGPSEGDLKRKRLRRGTLLRVDCEARALKQWTTPFHAFITSPLTGQVLLDEADLLRVVDW